MRQVITVAWGIKLGKVGWENTQTGQAVEMRTSGGRVFDRSGCYKMYMVRMSVIRTDELAKFKGLNGW